MSTASSGLNENHRRALTAAFQHLDKLLTDVEAASAATRSSLSEFVADLSPTQQQVLADSVSQLRSKMTDALKAMDIRIQIPDRPASWAIQTGLSLARITVQEIAPKKLLGYGPLGDGTLALIGQLDADLERGIGRIQAYLSQGLGKDLAQRLDRLGKAPVDVRLLQCLERIVREHGLVEYLGALESLLERLESHTFEIAVFGRVSSGKSFLLNAVLGFDALPVGITPVTAVPTRVTWGESPGAEIRFADAPNLETPIERLPEFVSEAGNPENRKHVVRAVVRIPSPELRRGVVFVDTPGVGSLARAGARESYAYLPRCDLGVLLIDAASTPGREDLELLRLLYESGIPGRVVVSKADLLSEPDRARLVDYIRRQIAENLGLDLPVHLVSTAGGAALARQWFADEIAPLLGRAEELAQASACRKLASLKEGVAASLEAVLSVGRGGNGSRGEHVEQLALEAEGRLQEAIHEGERLADRARTLAEPTLAVAAGEVARRAAASSGRGSAGEVVGRAIADTASNVRAEVQETALAARDRLREILLEMARDLDRRTPDAGDLSLDLLTLPALVPPNEVPVVRVAWPRWIARFPSRLEKRIHRDLSAPLREPLTSAYRSFGRNLWDWLHASLSRLAEQFAAQAEPLRGEARRLSEGAAGRDAERIAADLAEIERFELAAAMAPAGGRESR